MFMQTFAGVEFVRGTIVGEVAIRPLGYETMAAAQADMDHAIVTIVAGITENRPTEQPDAVIVSVQRVGTRFAVGILAGGAGRLADAFSCIVGYAGAAFIEEYDLKLEQGNCDLEGE